MEKLYHNFEPIYDKNSKILILGSFPSVKSRENNFYYGHPQNRFWKVPASVFGCEIPMSADDKKKFLLSNNIALWDVIKSCEINNSSDSTIKSVEVNELTEILDNCNIKAIYTNGKTAEKLFNQYIKKKIKRETIGLPSTSPANAAWGLDRLIASWQIIKEEVN